MMLCPWYIYSGYCLYCCGAVMVLMKPPWTHIQTYIYTTIADTFRDTHFRETHFDVRCCVLWRLRTDTAAAACWINGNTQTRLQLVIVYRAYSRQFSMTTTVTVRQCNSVSATVQRLNSMVYTQTRLQLVIIYRAYLRQFSMMTTVTVWQCNSAVRQCGD